MRIEVVRVVKAELNEDEFETLMLALDDAAMNSSGQLRDKAGVMQTAFRDALAPVQPVDEHPWS